MSWESIGTVVDGFMADLARDRCKRPREEFDGQEGPRNPPCPICAGYTFVARKWPTGANQNGLVTGRRGGRMPPGRPAALEGVRSETGNVR